MAIRQASRDFKIDKSLLSKRARGIVPMKRGRKTCLTAEEEASLAENLKIMAKWGFGLMKNEILDVVREYVEQLNKKTPFKDHRPGLDWFRGFIKRNKLSVKRCEPLEQARRKATSDPYIIYGFYDLVEKEAARLNLLTSPQQIWNLDESGICTDPTKTKSVAGRGQIAHRNIQGSGRENLTVLACVNASGKALPPLIIFSGSHLWSSWKGTKDLDGTTYAVSEKGWMNAEIFNSWFDQFCKTVTERPLLLIFDGHLSHLDLQTIEKAIKENIAIIKLPPHTTDLLQPLDKCVFAPFKTVWDNRLVVWQRDNQRKLTKSDFANLICSLWQDGMKRENIVSGFKSTGIWPVDRSKYPTARLDGHKLERYNRNEPEERENGLLNADDGPQEPLLPRPFPEVTAGQTFPPRPAETPGRSSADDEPNTPRTNATSPFEISLLKKINKTNPPKQTRRKVDMAARVITSAEFLEGIKAKVDNPPKKTKPVPKNNKTQKKTTKRRRPPSPLESDSVSDEELASVLHDSSDDDDLSSDNFEENINNDVEDVEDIANKSSIKQGDFILVKFAGGRRLSTYFRYLCVVQSVKDEELEVMSFLAVNRDKTVFKAIEKDVSVVSVHKVIGKLSNPELQQSGDRITYRFKSSVDVYES